MALQTLYNYYWTCTKLYRPCCVAIAVSFSGFHSGRHLICFTDETVMLQAICYGHVGVCLTLHWWKQLSK